MFLSVWGRAELASRDLYIGEKEEVKKGLVASTCCKSFAYTKELGYMYRSV